MNTYVHPTNTSVPLWTPTPMPTTPVGATPPSMMHHHNDTVPTGYQPPMTVPALPLVTAQPPSQQPVYDYQPQLHHQRTAPMIDTPPPPSSVAFANIHPAIYDAKTSASAFKPPMPQIVPDWLRDVLIIAAVAVIVTHPRSRSAVSSWLPMVNGDKQTSLLGLAVTGLMIGAGAVGIRYLMLRGRGL